MTTTASRRSVPPEEFYRPLGHRLRVVRLALDITEQEAAAAAGLSIRTYRRWESGCPQKRRGGTNNLLSFAEKYDVSLDWLLCGVGTRVGSHLASAKGRVVILPARGTRGQRLPPAA